MEVSHFCKQHIALPHTVSISSRWPSAIEQVKRHRWYNLSPMAGNTNCAIAQQAYFVPKLNYVCTHCKTDLIKLCLDLMQGTEQQK